MQTRTFGLAVLAVMSMLMAGCWEQNDDVTIRENGDVTFRSIVTITDEKMKMEDVREASRGFLDPLGKAGWALEQRWLSERFPYRMEVTGAANITDIADASDFYRLRKLDEKTYEVRFTGSELPWEKRQMTFSCGLLESCAKVIDRNGNEIRKIEQVTEDEVYRIVF
jgi:hypothetical protein